MREAIFLAADCVEVFFVKSKMLGLMKFIDNSLFSRGA